ncbi:MAG: class I SAM-dependent methyltransferase [Dehalococcoidia bacterium]|nr:class I SAM-dependent methyltransferase [Dehalococcoidia bacterium]
MHRRDDWEKFFDGHAPVYMDNCFTKNTVNEVDFLIKELRLKRGASILDVGCGAGRHAVELARRGYTVTGVDISSGMLAEARKRAEEAGVSVTLVHANAARMQLGRQFDAVICLCEGAFGLLGRGDDALEQPLAILRGVARALKPGARCLFTVLNGYRMARGHSQADVGKNTFDPLTLSEVSDVSIPGVISAMRERAFMPTELTLLFRTAGLNVLHIWGGTAGDWRRGMINLDEMEIMVVAEKKRRLRTSGRRTGFPPAR